jgi:hypothetical protein
MKKRKPSSIDGTAFYIIAPGRKKFKISLMMP